VVNASEYPFEETGALGERVVVAVKNVSLEGDCSPCTFTWNRDRGILEASPNTSIHFPQGNYTVRFQGPVKDYHLVLAYSQPYRVEVTLPEGYGVQNFLLGYVAPGGQVSITGNTTTIVWNSTRTADVRFYNREREDLLFLFGNFWIIIAIVLLMPYILTRRRKGSA
jgi:hypothetical protein